MLFVLAFLTLFNTGKPGIKIDSAWIRPADKGMNSALYFEIKNNTDKPDTLFGVSSDAAKMVMIHESFKKDGLMGMRHIKFLVINAHSSVKLEPGGYHVMFVQLTKRLKVDGHISATLHFKNAGTVKIKALVKKQS
jgi:copper(I)-binding protein